MEPVNFNQEIRINYSCMKVSILNIFDCIENTFLNTNIIFFCAQHNFTNWKNLLSRGL